MKAKNKKEEQQRRKQAHIDQRKASKKRRRKGKILKRDTPNKEQKERILIVCEGEKTEPSYFKLFRLSTAVIKAIGEGKNTISLVEQTRQIALKEDYDQVWCVFDKDDFPAKNFNNAIYKAESYGYQVAYSNQAFEYWLILHFEDHQGGAMDRNEYCKKLNDYLINFNTQYDCDRKEITEDIFEILNAKVSSKGTTRQELAIKRAKRNMEFLDNMNPANEESSTKVYKLVEELKKFK